MRDFVIITLLFTVFSFLSNQLFGQDKASLKSEQEPLSYVDEDSFVGPRLPIAVKPEPETKPSKTRTVNLETVNNHGSESTVLTLIDDQGEVSVFEWQGTSVPTDIQEELKYLKIDLSTINRLSSGEDLNSKYSFSRRQPDYPDLQLVNESVSNIDGAEFRIHVRASKDGLRKKVTISGPDESERSYRWDGDMPDSIQKELGRLEPSLLKYLGLDDAIVPPSKM